MEFGKLLTLFAVFLAVSGVAMALNGTNVQATDLTRWEAAAISNSDLTEGGNITRVDLGSEQLTDRWAGYFGNITSSLILTDNDSNASTTYLYRWAQNASDAKGEVCASTNSSFDFSSAGATTAAEIDTAWGFLGGLDLATNTFNDGTCDNLTFDQDSNNVSGAPEADGDSGLSTFSTCTIDDGTATPAKDNIAFCVEAVQNVSTGKNYRNDSVNFEFIVATNETFAGTETYYFFIELDA